MNIGVVGSRTFNNYELLRDNLCYYLYHHEGKHTIVSGGAIGADSLAERFADEFNLEKLIFKPKWDLYGKSAGFRRNIQIIENSDIVFAFWDGKSKGAQHSINLAKEMSKSLYIVKFNY